MKLESNFIVHLYRQGAKTNNLYSSNSKSKGNILVTDAKSKSGKGKGSIYGQGSKGKGSNGNSVMLVNLSDPAGGCPSGSEIKLCHTVTDTCVQTVKVSGKACSCSLSIPSDDSKDHYCIKVNAPEYTCSGGIGSSCVQNLDSTNQTEFCVQLKPANSSSGQVSTGSSNFTSTSNVTYRQTQVIVVTTSDQSCKSDATVKLSDCGTQETLAKFTTTSENCATSFTLPASKTQFCINVIAANYTCSGSMSSDCTSGPIEIPVSSVDVTPYEVIMRPVLGTVELFLNMSESIKQELSSTSITYSLVKQNGVVEATKVSDCQGVSFPNMHAGTYSISYPAIPGYTCGGNLVKGNECQTETVACTSGNKTTIIYNIDKITPKPTNKPTLPPAALLPSSLTQGPVPLVPPIPDLSKPLTTPAKSPAPVTSFANATYIVNVVNSGAPSSGNQVEFIAAQTNQTIEICITSAQGKCIFKPSNTDLSYIVKVTPSAGTTCKESCTVTMTLTPGEIPEYTVVLVPIGSSAVINVVKSGKPVSGVKVDFFITGNLDKIIGTNITTTDGNCIFSPEGSDVAYTATVTPPEGTTCQQSCTTTIKLTPGTASEYTVVLTDEASTLIIKVENEGVSVPEAQVSFSTQSNTANILESCTTTTSTKQCLLKVENNFDVQYVSTITAPAGYSCPEKGCSASFTLVPGKNMEYTFNLVKNPVPSGEAVVTVLYSGKCVEGAQVKIFDPSNPTVILKSLTTTSSDCMVTFTTTEVGIVYNATVIPPSDSFLCSGDFDSSCSATVTVVVNVKTTIQCILVVITPPPVTAPTKKPVIPPTSKPTKKPVAASPTDSPVVKIQSATKSPTKKPLNPPTPKPNKPTEKPANPPTPKPTKKPVTASPTYAPVKRESATISPTKRPVTPPTPKPTKSPTKKPRLPPTLKPTKKPVVLPTAKPVNPPSKKAYASISNDKPL